MGGRYVSRLFGDRFLHPRGVLAQALLAGVGQRVDVGDALLARFEKSRVHERPERTVETLGVDPLVVVPGETRLELLAGTLAFVGEDDTDVPAPTAREPLGHGYDSTDAHSTVIVRRRRRESHRQPRTDIDRASGAVARDRRRVRTPVRSRRSRASRPRATDDRRTPPAPVATAVCSDSGCDVSASEHRDSGPRPVVDPRGRAPC